MDLKSKIRTVPHWPIEGVMFRDITTLLQDGEAFKSACDELYNRYKDEKIDVVVAPALGGITLAYETARALGVRGIFTERQAGKMALRRGFQIKKAEKVLVVEDVVTTGLSTKEVIDVVKSSGGIIAGVASIIDRSAGSVKFDAPFKSLAKLVVKTYNENECPLCKGGTPITKPGSRKI